jgi:phage portal protein BeeE
MMGMPTDEQKEDALLKYNNLVDKGVGILESGMDFIPLSVPPNDGQLLESRSFNILDIARFFGVPGSKVLSKDTINYNSVE